MPVSPALAEDLATQVRDLYEAAEHELLMILARALAADLNSPRWAELRVRAVGDLLEAVNRVAAGLQQDTTGAVRRALVAAYDRGRHAAVVEIGALDIGRELTVRRELPTASAVDRLAASLAADTRPLYARITRSVSDAYQRVIARAASSSLLAVQTNRQATQSALDQFANRGITGFIDRSGRSWDMVSYAEMAVRSVTARAAIDGHIDAIGELGIGLVVVSAVPMRCPLCKPWEGKVLSLSGPDGERTETARHAYRTRTGLLRRLTMMDVDVAGSLIEARGRGLFHPNCRHSLAAYLPGVTVPPEPVPQRATYEDTQQQRYLERQVRFWKRRAAVALDERARTGPNARVRAYQARLREHVRETGLSRRYEREQVGSAF